MNLIAAIILGLWVAIWTLASVREILMARVVRVERSITSGEELS
jgi:hypothetical protein